VTLVVASGGGDEKAPARDDLPGVEEELRDRLARGQPPSAIAREVAKARGLVRADVYALLERIRKP
jgi:16S rRNA (cytidine1402-2'-O)-methyltransferase